MESDCPSGRHAPSFIHDIDEHAPHVELWQFLPELNEIQIKRQEAFSERRHRHVCDL